MATLYENLVREAKENKINNPEVKALLEDPAKFFSESVEVLTEDLDKQAMKYDPSSRDFVTRKVLENEAHALYRSLLMEDTTTTTLPAGQDITFTTVALPLVRKIFDTLIAMNLVSVQPISQPTAKVFYLDFLYNTGGASVYEEKDVDYSDNVEAPSSVKEIDLKLTSETVTAVNKKLKAKWSVEVEQDLSAYHGLSVESELMAILQTQITREVDGMIIAALLAGAAGTGSGTGTGAGDVNWNSTGYLAGDTSTTFQRDYRKTIYEAIEDAANLVFKKRYQYPTWIVGHPDAVVRLEKLEDFKISPGAADNARTIGRHLVGTLSGRYDVYKDPFFPYTNKLLLGYKGAEWGNSVGFYAPYIPLYMTPKIIDANDFIPRRGLMSRFAYGTLIKDGLATVTITAS